MAPTPASAAAPSTAAGEPPYETLELLIGPGFTAGTGTVREPVVNPATGAVLAELPHASEADLDRAVAAATAAFPGWRDTPPFDRQQVMERAARLMEERRAAIARTLTLEQGKPLAEALAEVDFVVAVTRWYGEEGKRAYGRTVPARVPGVRQTVIREPVGPVAAFVAWNFPGSNVIRKVAGAIGAGCSIVLKPSEETPGTAIAIARAFRDAGLPDGVLNVVFGVPDAVSRRILAAPAIRKLSFTGSVAIGKHLTKLAADTLKRTTMELGGHAPVLVFADADIERAAAQMAGFKYRNAGQVCISPTRFYVERSVYGDFLDAFAAKAKAVTVGDGLDPAVRMGPLIAPRRIEVMERLVADAVARGARVAAGGERIGNQGSFYAPTVLADVPDDAAVVNEEPFGPLAPVAPFDGLDEAIGRANRLSVGLAAYAYTGSSRVAGALADRINAGMLGINHPGVSTAETPFGGVDESGTGSEGGIEGLEAYQRTRFVTEVRL